MSYKKQSKNNRFNLPNNLLKGLGILLFTLFIISVLLRFHLKTEHRFRIRNLESVKQHIILIHLAKEDSILVSLRKRHLVSFNIEKRLKSLLVYSRDDFVLPLLSKEERNEIHTIIKEAQLFKTLIKQKTSNELKLKHDAVFNILIGKITRVEKQIVKRFVKQNKFLFTIQIVLAVVLIVWFIMTMVSLKDIKQERKKILSKQEKLLTELKRNNFFLQKAQDISNLGYYTFNLNTREWAASDFILYLVGYKKGDNILEDWENIVHPGDKDVFPKIFYDSTETDDFSFDLTYRIIRKPDGKIRWIHHVASKLEDTDNQSDIAVIGVMQDITQRKMAEDKIKFSDAILQKIDSIVLVNDFNANVIYASPGVKSILGYEPKEVLGQGWWQLTFSDKEALKKSKNRIANYRFEKGSLESSIRQIKTKDGAFRWIEWHNSKGFNNTYISVGMDITKRKEDEEKLKQSDTILNNLNSMVLVNDGHSNMIYASPSVKAILGYEPKELLGQGWWDLTYESAQEAKEVQKAVANYLYHDGPKSQRVTYRKIKTKTGDFRHIEWHISKGVGETYINIGVDITQRYREEQIKNIIFNITKEAQKHPQLVSLLHFVKESLSVVIDTSNFYVALYNAEKQNFSLPYVSGEDADMQGKTFPIGKSLTGYVLRKAQTTIITDSDFEVLRKKGEVNLVGKSSKIWVGVPLIEDNKVLGVLVVQSFTDEKAFTQKDVSLLELIAINIGVVIKQAQDLDRINLLNTALIQSPASVVITDIDGNIEYVNPTFTEFSGYTYEEAIGKNPRILKSGNTSEADYKDLWETLASGKIWSGEFLNKRKDGSKYLVAVNISGVKNNLGVVTHYIGIQEDITEKRQLERDYLNAFIDAQEQEKQSFGEDLHDGISQILAAEGMYIDILLQHENLDDKKVKKFLEMIKEHNLNTINDARRIAHGLMSKQLKQKGLLKALENICDDYNHSRNISFKFFNDKLKEKEINKTIKTNIYRVCQEVTTNILRHSGATKASVSFSKTIKNELKLVIEDNGAGIDFEKMKRENRGAGLKNIERRVTLLNGKLDLESTLDVGTKFTIIVPLEFI